MKKKNLNLILGSILTGLVLLVVLVGIFYTPYDPTAMDNANKLSGVTLAHPFGSANFGRDILSRVMQGSGTTLSVAVSTVAIGTLFGVLLGAFTGYFGGLLEV